MLNTMRFWLNLGIDGFRVDAVPYLCTYLYSLQFIKLVEQEGTNCENLPETHVFLKQMRKMMDDEYPGRKIDSKDSFL